MIVKLLVEIVICTHLETISVGHTGMGLLVVTVRKDILCHLISPAIEYFHGQYLIYVLIAAFMGLLVIIGLPLLVLLEPFVNSKINFIKIKPFLDQFQGC